MTGPENPGETLRRAATLMRERTAAIGPDVALAVADWLDSVARAERHEINGADIANALAVCRACLGDTLMPNHPRA